MVWLLLQETTENVEALSGRSGWVGAGLLGLVLCWLLFKHLPDKDRQMSEVGKEQRAQVENLITRHLEMEKEQRTHFREMLLTVLDRTEKQLDSISKALHEDLTALRKANETSIEILKQLTQQHP